MTEFANVRSESPDSNIHLFSPFPEPGEQAPFHSVEPGSDVWTAIEGCLSGPSDPRAARPGPIIFVGRLSEIEPASTEFWALMTVATRCGVPIIPVPLVLNPKDPNTYEFALYIRGMVDTAINKADAPVSGVILSERTRESLSIPNQRTIIPAELDLRGDFGYRSFSFRLPLPAAVIGLASGVLSALAGVSDAAARTRLVFVLDPSWRDNLAYPYSHFYLLGDSLLHFQPHCEIEYQSLETYRASSVSADASSNASLETSLVVNLTQHEIDPRGCKVFEPYVPNRETACLLSAAGCLVQASMRLRTKPV